MSFSRSTVRAFIRAQRATGRVATFASRRIFLSNGIRQFGFKASTGAAFGGAALMAAAVTVSQQPDWDQIRAEIASLLDIEGYDDGSLGPVFVRLAWHSCGSYDKKSGTGGSNGATMRFTPESGYGGNVGLGLARQVLEQIKLRHPAASYADLYQLAGIVAIEEAGGPKIPFRPGRTDAADGKACTPDGRLPDGGKTQQHVRDVFYRMGFDDKEIVALLGAHALGRCHLNRSGYEGPWTNAPTTFSNEFFRLLIEEKWELKTNGAGNKQYKNSDDTLMMLPADMALVQDPKFRVFVEKYAKDEQAFFNDFVPAWVKLQENGCKGLAAPVAFKAAPAAVVPAKPWYKFW